ncbi:MAG: 30S ribosomal protein S20 [Oscillospiraceae bacterium]|nr:30S ribosomal protein S20 [Oscillospiraceae bacterium]MDD6085625.1 30S ribosomal protein S20 [Oscillospiraceae bacterium]MDY3257121.1 30S ribosomal protein S20 [Ruminococcus callidus]
MPNIKSAKKRVKVNNTKAALNKARKTNLKTVIKNAENAIANSADNKQETVALALKKIDQAANKGLIHKNKAARKKSQLAKKLNAAG